MQWLGHGAHHNAFEGDPAFKDFEYTHTNVTHKRKVGESVRYVQRKTVQNAKGETEGLTMKISGTRCTDRFVLPSGGTGS